MDTPFASPAIYPARQHPRPSPHLPPIPAPAPTLSLLPSPFSQYSITFHCNLLNNIPHLSSRAPLPPLSPLPLPRRTPIRPGQPSLFPPPSRTRRRDPPSLSSHRQSRDRIDESHPRVWSLPNFPNSLGRAVQRSSVVRFVNWGLGWSTEDERGIGWWTAGLVDCWTAGKYDSLGARG